MDIYLIIEVSLLLIVLILQFNVFIKTKRKIKKLSKIFSESFNTKENKKEIQEIEPQNIDIENLKNKE